MMAGSNGSTGRIVVGTAAAAASLVLAGAGTAIAGTPTAQSDWSLSHQAWDSPKDKGGTDIVETAQKDAGSQHVLGRFNAYGEILAVSDYHDNGRRSIVKLWVGGSGPAVFYSDGDGTEKSFNLSYDEGQTVHLQACTSDGPNAVCTEKKAKGKT